MTATSGPSHPQRLSLLKHQLNGAFLLVRRAFVLLQNPFDHDVREPVVTRAIYFDIFRSMEMTAAVQSLSALGETTRLTIFRVLVEAGPEGLVVGRIAERVTVSAGTLTFHLKTLVNAGLICPTRRGTFIRYAANFDAMNGLLSFLTEKCCGGHPELCLPSMCNPTHEDQSRAA